MAHKTQSLENEKPERRGETENPAVPLESISEAVESFSRQFGTLVEGLQASNEAENRERRNYETNEFKWTKIAAMAGIGFSILSLILSGLTLGVLSKTLGVYRGQATIMATQAAIMEKQREITKDTIDAIIESGDSTWQMVKPLVLIKAFTPVERIGRVPHTLKMTVENFGGSTALSVGATAKILVQDSSLPPPPSGCPADNTVDPRGINRMPLRGGSSGTIPKLIMPAKGVNVADALGYNKTLYIVGCIYYCGTSKNRFMADICATWNPQAPPSEEFPFCTQPERNYPHPVDPIKWCGD